MNAYTHTHANTTHKHTYTHANTLTYTHKHTHTHHRRSPSPGRATSPAAVAYNPEKAAAQYGSRSAARRELMQGLASATTAYTAASPYQNNGARGRAAAQPDVHGPRMASRTVDLSAAGGDYGTFSSQTQARAHTCIYTHTHTITHTRKYTQ